MPNIQVGCLLPNGLTIKVGPKDQEKSITLRGANTAMRRDFITKGEVGITEVDEDLFKDWMQRHKDYDPVKRGLIFSHAKPDSVTSMAKEKKDVPTIDGINPKDPGKGIKAFDPKNPDAE
jgi:hypothetical protein